MTQILTAVINKDQQNLSSHVRLKQKAATQTITETADCQKLLKISLQKFHITVKLIPKIKIKLLNIWQCCILIDQIP